jgi:hypothetical protein
MKDINVYELDSTIAIYFGQDFDLTVPVKAWKLGFVLKCRDAMNGVNFSRFATGEFQC